MQNGIKILLANGLNTNQENQFVVMVQDVYPKILLTIPS